MSVVGATIYAAGRVKVPRTCVPNTIPVGQELKREILE